MHVSSCRTDIGKQMSFRKLTRLHKGLKTFTNILINSNRIRTSQSGHIECFTGSHEDK